jgi:hypothetical protein
MFIDGAQRKCWRNVSGGNTTAIGTKPQTVDFYFAKNLRKINIIQE